MKGNVRKRGRGIFFFFVASDVGDNSVQKAALYCMRGVLQSHQRQWGGGVGTMMSTHECKPGKML